MEALILNTEQANELRGLYGNIPSMLDPIKTKTGGFCLPVSVVFDPEFSSISDVLLNLPTGEVELEEVI